MSLQSNDNVDHGDGLSEAENEGQLTTLIEKVASIFSSLARNGIVRFVFRLLKWILGWIIYFPEDQTDKFKNISVQTDDIIQKLDSTQEVDNDDKKKASSSTKIGIHKIPTKSMSVQTDDIIQKCDCNKEVGKGDQKASINSSLTKKSNQKLPTKILTNLANEANKFAINIKQSGINYQEIDINGHSYDFSLSDHLKEKLQLAVSERVPLFLSFNQFCEAVILLYKHRLTREEEMCIVRYWLDKLLRCGYENAKFDNVIFNPVLIKLLFENEVMELYTKQTTLTYLFANFELEAMKFIKDHLKIFSKFCVGFSLCTDTEQCNGIILDILNEEAIFPYLFIYLFIYALMARVKSKNNKKRNQKITTSTNCLSLVPKIELKVRDWGSAWNFNYLHNREGVKTKQFIKNGEIMYSSSYEVANIGNPNIVFLINYIGYNNIRRLIDFKIERK
ncbi:unnamed protein product [Meloidogyne enterolobii]|uniref:Uncharacterized protein n=1 Tax=Meloidogyne enterolobii TaxID=390850 RepID=A0ACB0ZVP8_MELEN